MTFIQVLESEFYYLVEAIEHGCSDKEVINGLVEDLKKKTEKWKKKTENFQYF